MPDARAFVMTIDPARSVWTPGVDPTGGGTALNVRAVSQRCPHLGCRPNPCLRRLLVPLPVSSVTLRPARDQGSRRLLRAGRAKHGPLPDRGRSQRGPDRRHVAGVARPTPGGPRPAGPHPAAHAGWLHVTRAAGTRRGPIVRGLRGPGSSGCIPPHGAAATRWSRSNPDFALGWTSPAARSMPGSTIRPGCPSSWRSGRGVSERSPGQALSVSRSRPIGPATCSRPCPSPSWPRSWAVWPRSAAGLGAVTRPVVPAALRSSWRSSGTWPGPSP